MEEVDSIILHFLRQLNISIDDNIVNICDLPVETIVEAVSTCLRHIDPKIKVPPTLPPGISNRIEVAAQIAAICKDLGYKNDVGYQTFLYYNEVELRQVFMFLIENLPTEGNNVPTPMPKPKSLLLQDIGRKIKEELNTIWIPPCCKPTYNRVGDGQFMSSDSPNFAINRSIKLPEEELLEKYLKTKAKRKENEIVIQESAETTEVAFETDKTLKELKEMAIVLRQQVDTYESQKNMMEVEFSQVQKSCEKVEADLKNVENILSSIGISETELDNLPNNTLLEKVQKSIDMLHRNSEEITSKNLTIKVELDKLRSNNDLSGSERSRCKKVLISLKDTAKEMKNELEKRETLRNQVKENYEKLRKGHKRSVYTKRILEIISNVDKQNMEIKKILEDTRQIQKDINSLEGQLDRCFSIADETLFRDAKRDDQAKKAYKLLALLHSECNTIVALVNDMGTMSREIVDLEENIKTETAKRTEDTLKKIQSDLARMQKEC